MINLNKAAHNISLCIVIIITSVSLCCKAVNSTVWYTTEKEVISKFPTFQIIIKVFSPQIGGALDWQSAGWCRDKRPGVCRRVKDQAALPWVGWRGGWGEGRPGAVPDLPCLDKASKTCGGISMRHHTWRKRQLNPSPAPRLWLRRV